METEEETRRILNEILALFRDEKAVHSNDVDRIWSFCQQMLQHHDTMSSDVHCLLNDSEARINSTNKMVHDLTESCNKLVEINSTLRDSYVAQFESAQKQNEHLLAENARLLKENEAYYTALKHERERNDQIMQSMVSFLCNGRNSHPLVNIDQKPNINK